MRREVVLWAVVLATAGCERVVDRMDFERMIDQSKYVAYEYSSFFDDGRAMRTPPGGTVHRTQILGPPELTEGFIDGQYVQTMPLRITAPLLQGGRRDFNVYCAACHGVLGDGNTQVAENMTLRKPPSFHQPPLSEYPPGRVYRAIAEGYGLMPSYASELSVVRRWAVVAYVEALQLSQSVTLADLPPRLRERAMEVLP